MNVKWDIVLRPDQRTNPVMRSIQLPDEQIQRAFNPSDDCMKSVFPSGKPSLKTWGRTPGQKIDDAHWLAVCKQTPLHTDPAYPRYTHHLVLRVDNFVLRGIDKVETPLRRGMVFTLDTHSPHQLFAKDKAALYYAACSVDFHEPKDPSEVARSLVLHSSVFVFLTREITQPNNGGRWQRTQ